MDIQSVYRSLSFAVMRDAMMQTYGFQTKAENAFCFLCQDHGFSLRESTATRVVFESPRVCLFVGFDAGRSFELDVLMSLCNEIARVAAEPPYRLSEILGSLGVAKEERFETIQVTTEEAMERLLGFMAQAVRDYGRDFIEGDVSAYRRVGRYRDQECHAYRRDQELARAREVAAAAWRKKDYSSVVQALSQVEELLSKSDLKRLEIARRRDSSTRRT